MMLSTQTHDAYVPVVQSTSPAELELTEQSQSIHHICDNCITFSTDVAMSARKVRV